MSRECKIGIISLGLIALLLGIYGVSWAEPLELIKDGEFEKVYKLIVKPGVPPFEIRLKLNDDPAYKIVENIEIYRNKKLLQTFVIGEDRMVPINEGLIDFETEDVNFDGYNDLKLLASLGATGNEWWLFWLYDPVKGRFESNGKLSSLCSPRVDKQKKTIHTWYNGGGLSYIIEVYLWEGKKLVLILDAGQDFDEKRGKFHKIIKKRQDGKMVIVSDRYLSSEEATEENHKGKWLDY